MTITDMPVTEVIEPGVYDMDADTYHARPELSSSGARRLLPPSCPALFEHERTRTRAPKKIFDVGHAAHMLVLGEGPAIRLIDADDWRTKAAKTARDAAYADGAVPLLPIDYEQVQAMADAIRVHPAASALLMPDTGRPERSLFWIDPRTGMRLRARLDWLPNACGARMIVPDYKTCAKGDLVSIGRSIYTYGYHQQASWYLDAVRALGLAGDDAVFVLICQEKTAPYLVTVVQVDAMALLIGADRNRRAIDRFAECTACGRWPGYSDEIELLGVPAWAENEYMREMS
jgi:PDDEXK-like domain of unknown function (DUF3799)